MPALTIRLPHDAAAALRDLAQVECRTPRDQAAFLVIQGLRGTAASHATPAAARRRRGLPDRSRAGGDAEEADA
jgi:hypothetical protein